MRLSALIAALVVAVPLGLASGPASAQFFEGQGLFGGRPNTPKGPWCANSNSGADRVEEDCSFTSLAACQRALVNPNSGFCTQTFSGTVQPQRARKRNRLR